MPYCVTALICSLAKTYLFTVADNSYPVVALIYIVEGLSTCKAANEILSYNNKHIFLKSPKHLHASLNVEKYIKIYTCS